jgi:hypothetical protein
VDLVFINTHSELVFAPQLSSTHGVVVEKESGISRLVRPSYVGLVQKQKNLFSALELVDIRICVTKSSRGNSTEIKEFRFPRLNKKDV